MRAISIVIIILFNPFTLFGQISDSGKIATVIIEESNQKDFDSLFFQSIKINSSSTSGTIASELSQIAGVQSYNMGPGNNKLSIRGFSGNRIAMIVDGLKLDNQQWQDEHGLGLFPFLNDRLIIGYGPNVSKSMSEALGGCVEINTNSKINRLDIGSNFQSNSLGMNLNIEYNRLSSPETSSWFNIAISDFGDYLDAKNTTILNSRFRQIQLKAGKETIFLKNIKSKLNLRAYVSQTGIARISDSNELNQVKLSEPRDYEGPNHLVSMIIGSIQSSSKFSNWGNIKHTLGFTSNTRIEMEDNHPQGLGMQVNSIQNTFKFEKTKKKWISFFEIYNSYQLNTNFGTEKIIPNYWLAETRFNLSGNLIPKMKNLHYSLGINNYLISNSAEKESMNRMIKNFGLFYTYSNKFFEIIGKVSHSERNPNIHELFANGISEDAFRYDFGNRYLKPEKLNQLEIAISKSTSNISFIFRGFLGSWNDYIALSESGTFRQNAPLFEYKSFSGTNYGFENQIEYSLKNCNSKLIADFDASVFNFSKKLPFLPPSSQKLTWVFNPLGMKFPKYPEFKIEFANYLTLNSLNNEKGFNHYHLINVKIEKQVHNYSFSLQVRNLTNQYYIDPMSMLKLIPYHAMGINILFGIYVKM